MKKGFTLIELLGVIVILGVLILILFPNILNQVKKSKKVINSSLESLVIEASKDYYEDNIKNYQQIEGITYCIEIDDLTEKNYLNEKLKDADLNNIDTTRSVKVKYTNNKYQYEITDNCTETLSRNGIEVPVVTENAGLYESQIEGGRLIYRGNSADANNWIWLDENNDKTQTSTELYRIISFEEDGTIKVVRDEKLSPDRAFDSRTSSSAGPRKNSNNTYCIYSGTYYGCNVWGNQNNTLFNGTSLGDNFQYSYYDSASATTLTNGELGTVSIEATLNQYLNNGSWAPLEYLDTYIDNHKFNAGGIYYHKGYTGGNKGIKGEKKEESLYTWTGKIGLLNITEYAEASLNESCDVYTNFGYNPALYYYKDPGTSSASIHTPSTGWPCMESNWTSKSYHQWSLSPFSSDHYDVWVVMASGYFSNGYVSFASGGVRPAFYLKSSIVLSGEGTSTNPYKIQ